MSLKMTLRRCANPRCWRSFPIDSCSPIMFCDEDCHWDFVLQLDATAPPPAAETIPPPRERPKLDAWATRR